MPNRVACETLHAMCLVCKVNCATWRAEHAEGDGCWTLDACDAVGPRWLVHHVDLPKAVVPFGETLGVDWEDG